MVTRTPCVLLELALIAGILTIWLEALPGFWKVAAGATVGAISAHEYVGVPGAPPV